MLGCEVILILIILALENDEKNKFVVAWKNLTKREQKETGKEVDGENKIRGEYKQNDWMNVQKLKKKKKSGNNKKIQWKPKSLL